MVYGLVQTSSATSGAGESKDPQPEKGKGKKKREKDGEMGLKQPQAPVHCGIDPAIKKLHRKEPGIPGR